MADQQITQLPEETGTVASTFPLAIVNVTAAETRKITTANLATAIFSNLGTGGLDAAKVGSGIDGSKLVDDSVSNAKLDNNSVNFGGINVALGASDPTPAFDLSDATNYPCSSLTGTITNSQLAGSIANGKLANSAVSFGGISVSLGDSDSTPRFDLTDAINYPTSSLEGTITNDQLAGSIANGKLANSSISFGGISLALGASDPHPAFDLQDSTGYKTTNLEGTITNDQLAGSIDASKLVANSLTTDQLGPDCVGASELATNAVDTANIQDGKIVNDKIETSTNSSTGLDGSTKLRAGSVPASKLDASTVGNGLTINSNVLSINNTITGATSLGLTFSNQGICTGIAALQASDLSGVLATSSAVGVVKVPSSGGLSVSGSGDLSLASTVTAHTTRGIAVNAFGQVTSITATITSDALPLSSTTAVGAIKVPSSSSPLAVDSAGVLSIGVSGVTAGTGYTKFNVSDKGIVTSASALAASDIPNISAALLTSGTIDAGRIGQIISGAKLTDSSTTVFGGPGSTSNITTFPSAGDFKGQRFWDEYNSDEYIWTGSSWTPVTITAGELVFLGLYSASDNTVSSVTTSGAAAGLTANNALPSASNTNKRGYVVVDDTGTGSGNAPAVTLNAPDYLLSDGTAWKHVDVSSAIAATSANQVSVSATGDDITNNVQASLENLQTNKIRKTGGEMSGLLRITHTGSLAFEGSSDDAFETFLSTVNPTDSDKTILLPNISGTLITTADTNTVTSTMVDGSLANANLAANAAIALSKIASVSAGQILVGAASTGAITAVTPSGDIALSSAGAFSYVAGSISNADINASAGISASKIDVASVSQAGCVQLSSATTSTSATKAATPAAVKIAKDAADAAQTTADAALATTGGALTGNLTLNAQSLVRFADSDSSNFIALKAPATIASDITLTLPSSAPAANQILKANSSTPTTLEWAADTTNTAAADLTGNTLASGVTASSLESVGTLASLGISGNLTVDTNALYVDATNNRVGINQTPTRELSIHSPDNNNALIHFTNDDTGETASDGIVIGLDGNENLVINNQEASKTINFHNGGSQRMQIDSSGRLLVGVTASRAVNQAQGSFQIEGTGANDSDMSIIRNQASAGGPALCFGKSRNASLGGNTVVNDDDQLGAIIFNGNDGTDLANQGARIDAYVDGSPGSDNIPGRLVFSTTSSGATSTEALRLDSSLNATFAGGAGIGTSAITGTVQLDVVGAIGGVRAKVTTNNGGYKIFEGLSSGGTSVFSVTHNGRVTGNDGVYDSKGELRNIPLVGPKSAAYELIASDAGKHVRTNSNITVPANTLNEGDAVTIINASSGEITIFEGTGQGLWNSATATTGDKKLAGRGMATILFSASGNSAYISGAGLTDA